MDCLLKAVFRESQGPTQDEILNLLKEYKLTTQPTYNTGKSVQYTEGKLATFAGTIPPLSILGLVDLHFAIKKIDSWAKTVRVSYLLSPACLTYTPPPPQG